MKTIRFELIPALVGKQHISDEDRNLFALPPRLGGLGIDILPQIADRLHKNSKVITEPLKESLLKMGTDESTNTQTNQDHLRQQVKRENNVEQKRKVDEVHADLDVTTRRAMELAQEKGASIWLTTIPL